jgi:hypothetical protein
MALIAVPGNSFRFWGNGQDPESGKFFGAIDEQSAFPAKSLCDFDEFGEEGV